MKLSPGTGGTLTVVSGVKEYAQLNPRNVPPAARRGRIHLENLARIALDSTGVATNIRSGGRATHQQPPPVVSSEFSQIQSFPWGGDGRPDPTGMILSEII